MKKLFSISMLGVLIIVFSTTTVSAKTYWDTSPKNYITLSFSIKPTNLNYKHPCLGYKHRLFSTVYLSGNLGYRSSKSDLEFQTGAEYLFPHKIIIFRIYAGGGVQFSRNEGYQYPYIAVGTNFIFLFSEVIYPMEKDKDPVYRAGFSFKF